MKSFKQLWVVTMAAAALMAFVGVGTASATTLTDGSGSHPTVVGASSSHVNFHNGFFNITCTNSFIEFKPSTGGTGATVEGPINFMSFTGCGSWTVTVVKAGSLVIHGTGSNNGTLTWAGGSVTVEGFGLHCGLTTDAIDIGTVTGSANTKGHAKYDINGLIPRTYGVSGVFCGSAASFTGTYTIFSPNSLNVDA